MCLVYTAAMRAVHYLVIAIFHLRVREAELVTAVGTAALRVVCWYLLTHTDKSTSAWIPL